MSLILTPPYNSLVPWECSELSMILWGPAPSHPSTNRNSWPTPSLFQCQDASVDLLFKCLTFWSIFAFLFFGSFFSFELAPNKIDSFSDSNWMPPPSWS
ncbi:hypothetical protein [Mycoplasma wenyonii]|uniref:hypothetical protein n=1 Tax=Mycoplasma wenyonii TaxID=65123 RepID=UPI001EE692DD|nr:hypothetical protein [Mycoplasma wenyonii]